MPPAVLVQKPARRLQHQRLDRRSEGSVWTDGGCTAYYLDDDGRNFAL